MPPTVYTVREEEGMVDITVAISGALSNDQVVVILLSTQDNSAIGKPQSRHI